MTGTADLEGGELFGAMVVEFQSTVAGLGWSGPGVSQHVAAGARGSANLLIHARKPTGGTVGARAPRSP